MNFKQIPLEEIRIKRNYRKTFDEEKLKELADSIQAQGIIEPLVVTPNGRGYYLIAGERRYRAAKELGLLQVPCVIRENDTECDERVIQLVENSQRENVPFFETAQAVRRLRDEADLTVKEICKMTGLSQAHIYNLLKISELEGFAARIAERGQITQGVAVLIARIEDPLDQAEAAQYLARKKKSALVSQADAARYIYKTYGRAGQEKQQVSKKQFGHGGNAYAANWKDYLLRFDCEEFYKFKTICRGRTDTQIMAEAVEAVCLERDSEKAENG